MVNKIIRNYIAKMVAGRSDDGIMITLKDPQKVEFQTAMMQDLLMRRGIDPNAIQSEAQLKMIINQIKAIEKAEDAAQAGIRNTESAKVFNRMGEELDPNQPIIGGTQPGKSIDTDTFVRLAETNTQRMKQRISDKKIESDKPPPGSRGGDDDIAAPVQSSEESLKNMIEAENKKAIDNLKQKMAKEKSRTQRISGNLRADNMNRYEIGRPKLDEDEYDYYREILDDEENFVVKGDETREFLEAMVKEQEDEVAYMKRLYDKGALDDPEKKAYGGRIGFASGTDFNIEDELNKLRKQKGLAEDPSAGGNLIPDLSDPRVMSDIAVQTGLPTEPQKFKLEGDYFKTKIDYPSASDASAIKSIQNYKRNPDPDMRFTAPEISDFMGVDGIFKGLDKDQVQSIYDKVEMDNNEYDFSDIEGQTAFLDPFTVIGGLIKVGKGAKASALAKEFFKQKAKEKIGKEIYDKVQKKIKTPKYPTTPPPTTTGGGGADSGGGYTPTTTAQNVSRTSSRVDSSGNVKAYGLKDGGIMRLGFKDGMNRRTFLKFLAGAASIPIIGKVFKPFKVGKTVTKVPIIKTDNVPGKPEWFDQLVNKVILEGDDVTKRFATAERQSIHQKTLDDGSVVRVTEDVDDGAVRVEYESLDNVYEDMVQMQYKKPLPDEGDPKPMAEFTTAESGPVGRADGPDDYSIEIDEVGGTSISDLTSDVSKLKEYATGQKPTLKEFVQSKKRKDKARRITEGGEAEMDAVIERQGEFIENDLVDLDPPDYASGGIARMLGE